MFFRSQAQDYECKPVVSITIAQFLNLGRVALFTFLLIFYTVQVSVRAPEARGGAVSVRQRQTILVYFAWPTKRPGGHQSQLTIFVPPGQISLRGPACVGLCNCHEGHTYHEARQAQNVIKLDQQNVSVRSS